MPRYTVFLIDANRLFREGMRALFSDGDFAIAGEAATTSEVLPASGGQAPHLIMLDPGAADDAALSVTALKERFPEARIVLLATELDPVRMTDAIGAGADAFLLKDISQRALEQSLRLVVLGEKVFPSHLAALMLSGRVASGAPGPSDGKGLSRRELQIVQCLVNGDSNKMIANRLNITEATVKVHLKGLLRKINAANRTQAAIWGLNNGLGGAADRESAVA